MGRCHALQADACYTKGPGVASCLFYGILVALLVFSSSTALAAPTITAQLKDRFHEVLRDDVVVSGSVIVGVANASVLDGTALRTLAISPGLAPGAEICLAVTTRDGVYTALNSFVVPEATRPGQPVALPYDKSQYLARLGVYADTEVAIMASAGPCSVVAGKNYLVHRYGTARINTIRLFVNSFGATDVYASTSGPATDCTPITEGRRTTFDFICELALRQEDKGEFKATVQRERFGRQLPDVSVLIRHGD